MITERFAPDLGGVARSAERTALALARLGIEVHVLAWTKTLDPGMLDQETIEPDATQGSVAVHRLGLFSNMDFSMQHTLNVLEWLHGEYQFQAVWGHYVYPAGYMAVLFAEWAKVTSTVSARGNDIDRLMFPPGDFARLTWTLDRATAISAVSRDLSHKVGVLLSRDSQAIVIPNAVDLEVFSRQEADAALRDSLGIAADEAVLGFCGELRHKKGLPFLLNALTEVRQSREACLLIIGEVRPREQSHLSAYAAEHPDDAARIIVTERIDDRSQVARHLNLCDVFLQPSVWDGLPNAVLEAMACKRIVITSDAGGIAEAVESGVSGFVIPKAMLHRLGTAIGEVLDLPVEQRQEMQAAARRAVEDAYHADREGDALRIVLERLSANSSS